MADPSPETGAEAQEAEVTEGQVPAGEVELEEEESQEDTGKRTYSEAYVKQLRREAAGNRTRLSELESRLQEIEDADKSEQTKLSERLHDAETRAEEASLRLMRYEVASERGLDMKAAAFLTGSTREEIELRAEELSALLDVPKQTSSFDGGARRPAKEKLPPEQAHNDLLLEALGREPGRRAS